MYGAVMMGLAFTSLKNKPSNEEKANSAEGADSGQVTS
jgi:hypothetical protein